MSSFLRDAEAPDVTEPSLSGGAERRAQHWYHGSDALWLVEARPGRHLQANCLYDGQIPWPRLPDDRYTYVRRHYPDLEFNIDFEFYSNLNLYLDIDFHLDLDL